MTRYTTRDLEHADLEHAIGSANATLERHGSLIRTEQGGRNGYQAADEYSVDTDGLRTSSGVNRNIGCGTSREVAIYVSQWLASELARLLDAKIS